MVEISLRGDQWRGVSYESEFYPTTGRFTKMTGCFVSKDGTELVPFPGLKLIATPGFAEEYYPAMDNTVDTTLNPTGENRVYTHVVIPGPTPTYGPHTFKQIDTDATAGVALGDDYDSKLMVTSTSGVRAFMWMSQSGGCDLETGYWYDLYCGDTTYGAYGVTSASWSTGTNATVYIGSTLDRAALLGGPATTETIKVCRLPTEAYDAAGSDLFLGLFGFRECMGRIALLNKTQVHYNASEATPPVETYGTASIDSHGGCVSTRDASIESPLGYDDFIYAASSAEAHIRGDFIFAMDPSNDYKDASTPDAREILYSILAPKYKPTMESVDGRVVGAYYGMGMLSQYDFANNYAYYAYEATQLQSLPKERSGAKGSWKLDALGIPKAVMRGEGVDGLVTLGAHGGTGDYTAGETVYFCACYYNSKTGSYGVRSEIQSKVIAGAHPASEKGFVIDVMHPRFVMRETEADTIVFFATKPGEGNPASLYVQNIVTVGELASSASLATVFETFEVPIKSTAPTVFSYFDDFNSIIIPPVIPGMAMGAMIAKAAAGRLFCAGTSSTNVTTDDSVDIVLTDEAYDATAPEPYGYVSIRNPFLMSAKGIPSAYQGIEAYTFTGPIKHQRLPYVYNAVNSATRTFETRWKIPMSSAAGTSVGKEMALRLPKGHIWFSEKGEHDQFGGISRVIADRLAGRDIMAIGRHDDGLILCSEGETYYLSLRRSPYDQDAILVSNAFGCIAPGSMVECDDGCAWLSDRGPVFFSVRTGFRWIGRGVEARFNDDVQYPQGGVFAKAFKRDSRGFMMNVRGCYDRSRKLVFWLMRADIHNEGFADISGNPKVADPDRSLAGCDEIMIWSKESGAFSFHEAGGDMQWGDVSNVTVDGYKTACFMSNLPVRQKSSEHLGAGVFGETWSDASSTGIQIPGRIYALREDTHDRMAQTVQLTALDPVGQTLSGSTGSDGFYFIDQNASTDLRDDLDWYQDSSDAREVITYNAVIYSGTANPDGTRDIKWYGKVDRIYPGGLPTYGSRGVRMVDTFTSVWTTGDIMEIGTVEMVLESNLAAFRNDIRDQGKVRGVSFRHNVVSQATFETVREDLAWADVQVKGEGGWYPLDTKHPYGRPLRVAETTTRLMGGGVKGHDTAVRITIVGNGRPRLKDIRLEVEPGG